MHTTAKSDVDFIAAERASSNLQSKPTKNLDFICLLSFNQNSLRCNQSSLRAMAELRFDEIRRHKTLLLTPIDLFSCFMVSGERVLYHIWLLNVISTVLFCNS